MSWQEYVDINLMGSGKIAKAAIYLKASNQVIAASPDFSPTIEEMQRLSHGFTDPSPLQSSEVYIAGTQYMTLSASPDFLLGKKGADGFLAKKTNQAIIVGIYISPVQQAEAVNVVRGLADYLIGVGY